jgi:hypothetical protein
VLSACGASGEPGKPATGGPGGGFPVSVAAATFPASQRLAERTHLVIAVRNSGSSTIPNVAVTICNVTCTYPAPDGEGSGAQAFSANISQPYLANPSRPLWIVDRPPGPCGYGCQGGAQGGAVTAYSNTWALGPLAPGATARFDWAVTAVKAGRHVVAWEVAAGLDGKAKAVGPGGTPPHGTFAVQVRSGPERWRVTAGGRIVATQ